MKRIRIGLYILFAFSVFANGVVEVWSESVLEIGSSILLVCWAVIAYKDEDSNAAIQWSPLSWPLFGFVTIGVVQLVFRLTANPFLTRTELLRLAAYFIIFFLSVQAFRKRAELVKLAWFLIFLGFSVSLLGIIQNFTSEQAIYWVRHLPQYGGAPFGPYVNRNHFAGFVELIVPIGLAMLLFRGLRRDLLPMAGLLTIVPVGALMLTGSRGGIVSFAFEVGILVLLTRTRGTPELARTIQIGIIALAALALIAWLGAGKAIEKFSKISIGEVTLSRRVSMFKGAAHIFLDHPIKGVGLGTIVSVFPSYDPAYDGLVVDHVHNDYMEALAETGILGGICGLAFLWLLFRQAQKYFMAEQGHFSRALHAGAITAVCGLLLHSVVDFNLHIPSNAILFLLMAYLATSVPVASEASKPRRRIRKREKALAENEE